MDIFSTEQYEAMAFVAACNRSYYNPSGTETELWLDNREPAAAKYRIVRRKTAEGTRPFNFVNLPTASNRMIASMIGDSMRPMQDMIASYLGSVNFGLGAGPEYVTERSLVAPAETMIEHLVRITWLAEVVTPSGRESGLRLTELGRALLRDAETGEVSDEDVSVVFLGREDPLAYPTLVGQLAAAGPGLLVDPYLKLADLHTIAVSTQLTRLLVSGKTRNRAEVSAMQAYLGRGTLSRRVEVRSSTELHDRVLMADDGDVLTVGTSLNGVGRTTTVMSPIPSPSREAIKDVYEGLWSNASLVGPQLDENEDQEAYDREPVDGGSEESSEHPQDDPG